MSNSVNKSFAIPMSIFLIPGEKMPLYIFEEKYKKVIDLCMINSSELCIPYCTNSELKPFGSKVKIAEIIKRNNNEDYIIKVECTDNIKISAYIKPNTESVDEIEYNSSNNDSKVSNGILIDLYQKLSCVNTSSDITINTILKNTCLTSSEKYNIIAIPNSYEKEKMLINYLTILLNSKI